MIPSKGRMYKTTTIRLRIDGLVSVISAEKNDKYNFINEHWQENSD